MDNIRKYFDYLFRLERINMKYDLTNIKRLLNQAGNPHNNFKSIHIAGTNGKGSTASFIASILMEHGLRTGLFTSPHILRFNERIRVNGKCISDKIIIDFLNTNRNIIKRIKPSFFEVNTAMAFDYFSHKNIDVAVVECGLGGRLDSTNVLHPEISIITQIGMDHMQYLGNSLMQITLEKIGIVKKGTDVIVSDNNRELKNLFSRKISLDNLLYMDNILSVKIINSSIKGSKFIYKPKQGESQEYSIPLPGKFQTRNASAAIYASNKFLFDSGIIPLQKLVQKGLSKVKENSGYRCRIEAIKHNGTEYIFDISHNAEGIRQTYGTLKNRKPDIVIFGIMEDKNIITAVKQVLRISNTIIFTKPNYKRACEPAHLHKFGIKYGTRVHNFFISGNVNEAMNIAGKLKGKRILFTGSFFLVSDAIKALRLQKLF